MGMRNSLQSLWYHSVQHLYAPERPSSKQLHKLGLIYSIYRITIGVFLILQSYLDIRIKTSEGILPSLVQQVGMVFYSLLSFVLLGLWLSSENYRQRQLILGLGVDVVMLSLMLYTAGISDLQATMLYMVVVAASFMMLSASYAFFVTMLAIVFVIYKQFFLIFTSGFLNLSSLGDALLMCASFIAVGFLSWSVSQRSVQIEHLIMLRNEQNRQLNLINQEVINHMVNGVLVMNGERILLANQVAYQLLNLHEMVATKIGGEKYLPIHSAESLVILKEALMKDHHTLYQWLLEQQNQPESSVIYEVPALTKNAIHNKLRVSHTPLNSSQLLILEDLTREQAHAQQLKLASLGQLTASIAHEIRNPLAAISQASQLLIEDAQMTQDSVDSENLDPNLELYQMIFSQTKRVNRIIEDILSLSRQTKPNQEVLDITQWLSWFIAEHFRQHDVFLHSECQERILFDSRHLEQILINLINNGLRYSSRSHSHAYVEIEVYCRKSRVIIDVLDNGEGVKAENVGRLFDPFFTTDNDGTGLGLYLSQAFVEANQAKLTYVPDHEKTCFRLSVPKMDWQGE